jgi:hypothetical protein
MRYGQGRWQDRISVYFKIYGLIPRRSAAVKAVEKKKKKL